MLYRAERCSRPVTNRIRTTPRTRRHRAMTSPTTCWLRHDLTRHHDIDSTAADDDDGDDDGGEVHRTHEVRIRDWSHPTVNASLQVHPSSAAAVYCGAVDAGLENGCRARWEKNDNNRRKAVIPDGFSPGPVLFVCHFPFSLHFSSDSSDRQYLTPEPAALLVWFHLYDTFIRISPSTQLGADFIANLKVEMLQFLCIYNGENITKITRTYSIK